MMLSRRYNVLFRTRMACTAILTNDLMFRTSNLHKNCVAHSYCIANPYVNKFNVNTRSLSSTVDGNIVEDHKTKILTVNASVDSNDVSLNLVISIIDDFEKNDSSITEISSLMLLYSCGSMLKNEPLNIRQELVNRVWNLLKRAKCQLTINHYHALLQSYIDNDQMIDQNQFLEDMTVKPECDTYSLLLRVPSTDNSGFADSILSKLEQNSLPIDQKICNALMHAYAMSGNVEKIIRIAQLMEEKNVEGLPSLETNLMYAYARNGDIGALTDALKNTVLPVPHIMNLVKHLSLSKNGMHIPTVLNHIQSVTVKREDFINTVLQLIHADHVLDAYEIVTRVPLDEKLEDARKALLSQFLETIIKANKNRNTVKKIVNSIKENYSYPNIWNKVIELAVEQNGEELAFKILDEMKAMGVTLKAEYFHPLFLYIQKQNFKRDIYPVLKWMHTLDVEIDTETLVNYVFPCIDLRNACTEARRLCNHGVKSVYESGSVTRALR
ncbi:leucine-rich PPR motif-containing protein, mitochondrial isoform X2 [Ceratina calcarata]|uniref:Leucine-rich PPR motif-containing protein, mitochondrial isoform X2 n=1 Tax=Ceratina calcarata TaxID=156304 RepID=A0AAJ7WFW2_9HYME|nr:leucine-rich PPR motif-containing protein, mitochondrial isoform X2 [Ceratina calcarata]